MTDDTIAPKSSPDAYSDAALLRALAVVEEQGWSAAAAGLGCETRDVFAVIAVIHADLAQSEASK